MNTRDRTRLEHMLESARRATDLARGRARTDLDRDSLLADAIMWRITIIGEAAARIGPAGRALLPALPWTDIVGMRNRLVHGYDAIDLDRVWDTLTDDLPPLIAALEQLLTDEQDDEGD